MPRYYFHVQNDDFFTRDEEGTQLPSLGEACRHARRTIGEVIAEELAGKSSAIHISVTIEDDAGTRAANLAAVTMVVSSEDPKGKPPSNRRGPSAARRVSDEMRRSGVLPPANED